MNTNGTTNNDKTEVDTIDTENLLALKGNDQIVGSAITSMAGKHDEKQIDIVEHEQNINSMTEKNVEEQLLDKVEEEISKCEVRCANCHRKKTAKTFSWWRIKI